MITEQQNKMLKAMLNANPECKKLVKAYLKKFPEFLIKILNETKRLNFDDGIFAMEINEAGVECFNVDEGNLSIGLFPMYSGDVKNIKFHNGHITKKKFNDMFYNDEQFPQFDSLIGYINCCGHHYNFHIVEKKDGFYLVSTNINEIITEEENGQYLTSLNPNDAEFEIRETLVNLTDLVVNDYTFDPIVRVREEDIK